jgi:hypothetical protein
MMNHQSQPMPPVGHLLGSTCTLQQGGSAFAPLCHALGSYFEGLGLLASQRGLGLAVVASEVGAKLVVRPSLKAALDVASDDPAEQGRALEVSSEPWKPLSAGWQQVWG